MASKTNKVIRPDRRSTTPEGEPNQEAAIIFQELKLPKAKDVVDSDIERRKRLKKQAPNALIIDRERGWYLDKVASNRISEPFGHLWRFGKHVVYSLELVRNKGEPVVETLRPFGPANTIGILPDKGYRALFWKEAEILFTLENTLLDKLNLVGMYVLIAILLFFAYLLINSIGGK